MNISTIRSQLELLFSVRKKFIYTGSRGIHEEFVGKIIKIYPRIFIVSTEDGKTKSFSYSDFAIHALKIYPIKEKC